MNAPGLRSRPDWLAVWILFSAWCSLSGWILSCLGCLNVAGYAVSFALFLALLKFCGQSLGLWSQTTSPRFFRVLHGRFFVPKLWLLLAVLTALGGCLYHPSNFDYLTYRFPRVLHWGWEQAWYWIPTYNQRMNYSGPGFEWLMMPLFVFFKTDRLFFLLNFLSWLFLPGLVFGVFRQLGISPRVCWWWMWALPCGYCYILQAASTGNDSFAAVYLLAALYYALRDEGSSPANLLLSCLAVALLTGAKAANLPLALPWLIAVFFRRVHLFFPLRPGLWAGIAVLAGAASFLPMAVLNIHFTGDYSGDPLDHTRMKLTNRVTGIIGNAAQIAVANLAPPVWPKETDWSPLLPSGLKARLARDFPRLSLSAGQMQAEESCGAGLGLVLFTVSSLGLGLWARFCRPHGVVTGNCAGKWITAGAAVALLVFMAKIGSEAGPRLIAAYYPLLIAGGLIMASPDGSQVRRKLFQTFGLAAMISALPLVLLNPARPLFPVHFTTGLLVRLHAPAPLVSRFGQVYQIYASRFDAFTSLQSLIPGTETNIGVVQDGNVAEASLWRPYGSYQVNDVPVDSAPQDLAGTNIRFILVSDQALRYSFHVTLADLLQRWSATVVAQREFILIAHRGPETWYLLQR